MSSMNIDSPRSLNSLPIARRLKQIQKKRNQLFQQNSAYSCSSFASTTNVSPQSNKIKMALLNQINNQTSLNDLPVGFDNAYDFIEEFDEQHQPLSYDEQDHSHAQYLCSTTSYMDEEEDDDSICELKNASQILRSNHEVASQLKPNKTIQLIKINDIQLIRNDMDLMMKQSTDSQSSAFMRESNGSNQTNDTCGSHSDEIMDLMMMSSSTCMTALKSSNQNKKLTQFSHQPTYFMDEEEERYFTQLENKINDWLDAQGVQQVEPNSRKMSSSVKVSMNNSYSSSSLIQRRKLRNLTHF